MIYHIVITSLSNLLIWLQILIHGTLSALLQLYHRRYEMTKVNIQSIRIIYNNNISTMRIDIFLTRGHMHSLFLGHWLFWNTNSRSQFQIFITKTTCLSLRDIQQGVYFNRLHASFTKHVEYRGNMYLYFLEVLNRSFRNSRKILVLVVVNVITLLMILWQLS